MPIPSANSLSRSSLRQASTSKYEAKAIATPDLAEIGSAGVETETPTTSANAASSPDQPLNLGTTVIREANRYSKSGNRRLAEASGTYFGDNPISKSEALGNDVAKAGKQGCIGADENANILSVFVIAYKVIRDKCK
jgi:hypothetical protein